MKEKITYQYLRVWRYRELIANLVLRDIKNYYSTSFLGFLWSMVIPTVHIVIYYFAFHYVLNLRTPKFLLLLMSGILHLNFFNSSVTQSTAAIVENIHLIKKINFPRIALPLSTVLYNCIVFFMALLVFFPLSFFLGAIAGYHYFMWPLVFILQFIFTFGISLILSSYTVFLRDLRQIIQIVLMMMMWLSPVIYDFNKVPVVIKKYILLNPVASYILAYQDIIYRNQFPSIGVMSLCAMWSVVGFTLGIIIFSYFDPRFAEEV